MSDGSVLPHALSSRALVDGRISITYAGINRPWLVHGTIVFKDSGFESPDSAWRELVAGYVGRNIHPAPGKVVIPIQVHGGRVLTVGARSDGGPGGEVHCPTCDGLVTRDRGVMIGVNTADCIPLLAVSGSARVAGAAHCGWRGVSAGVVENFLVKLRAAVGQGGLGRMRFVMGASVGPCCYEVGEDFLRAFSGPEVSECAGTEGGRTVFDLRRLVGLRLIHGGIDRAAVFTDNTCTSCRGDELCSYRAGGKACGRMYTFAMITD